uniref:bifunctional aspartokinase/homoserine dehydrogenase 1 isoform X2 n=1 Tax=Erigeron canadensis TaxID=72917 RepID=UPI001CB8CF58|nr:bifunctional aspartokinase/homoserine dehydrogenase 1 isoform X2 [Erigeron canadensis]
MKNIPVILLGCGGVGRQLLHHIVSCRSLHASKGICLRVVGVCDSKSFIVSSDVLSTEFDDAFLLHICQTKADRLSLETCIESGKCEGFAFSDSVRKLTDIATRLGFVIVDCSASSETVGVISQVVNLGCCAVLANKKPLTCSMVGAGLPIITSLNRIISSGDTVRLIIGSLSGTLGYVMSEIEKGKAFSEVVKAAKDLGYTEPDPRDDLSGMDVARKGLILARLLGQRIDMKTVKIQSLYPDNMGPDMISVEDFLVNGLPLLDKGFEERIKKASSNGKVLRYVCILQNSRCDVKIHEVEKQSALGQLKGSDNVVEIYSRCYDLPLVIQGAGAGNDTTAAGVLADILDLQDLYP